MRIDVAHWRQLSVPIDGLGIDIDDTTRRIAELFDRCSSTVLDLGYGMGESVIVAADVDPERVRPLIEDLARFRDDEILGECRGLESTKRTRRAVQHRHALATLVREVVELHPKPDA